MQGLVQKSVRKQKRTHKITGRGSKETPPLRGDQSETNPRLSLALERGRRVGGRLPAGDTIKARRHIRFEHYLKSNRKHGSHEADSS